MLILVGSHDVLLERTIGLFNERYPQHLAVFGNVGSLGGLKALKRGLCHIAVSHLLQDDEEEYNFQYAQQELGGDFASVVNFCLREQGILLAKGNPKGIQSLKDLGKPGITMANRPASAGTRLLFDRELQKIGVAATQIKGYDREYRTHWDVAIEVLAGRADVAPGIRAVADIFGLDFLPVRWERYDLLISKNRFFEEGVQLFLNLLHNDAVKALAQELTGYDLNVCGKMVFAHPQSAELVPEPPKTKKQEKKAKKSSS
jgi:molybdate-binding protein